MNLNQEILQSRIKSLRKRISDLNEELSKLRHECGEEGHLVSNRGEEGDYAICLICGENLGWWCPKSPNHQCEYKESEWCIHCGAPEERK